MRDRKDITMELTKITRSLVRMVAVGMVAATVLLPVDQVSAAPEQVGLVECFPGECRTERSLARTTVTTVQRTGDLLGPRLLP